MLAGGQEPRSSQVVSVPNGMAGVSHEQFGPQRRS